jgi:endonuclease/exonuclease/phosphatase family metal-dependent hydrolase
MRSFFVSLLFSAFASTHLHAAAPAHADPTTPRPPLTLRVMSFNVRVPTSQPQPPDAWAYRRPVLKKLLEREVPDVIGTQEGVYPQLRDIAADLPDYDWIGLGREGGSKGEFCAIFYRRDRFEPVAFDHFWLSDTPNLVASITWGTAYHRMVSWARFRERDTGREFYFWNTHFDHQIETARQKSAQLIRERLAPLDPNVPLILVGDFNCAAGTSRASEILTNDAGLVDTWTIAAHRTNERLNTFHNYQPPLTEGQRIDWILARPPVDVPTAAIIDHHENGQHPSDHFPVTATLRFP